MLQAQALSVEVGGRLVVADASFTVMPRDKVGIVGRNGAGKTSLFKVLGGAVEPAAGSVVRKGGFGYLPQDPRIDQALEDRTAVTHVLSGRGIDDELVRIEKLRLAMEETPTERNVARYSRAEENFQVNGGYAAESEARALAAGLGLDETRMELPIGVLSGGERRRVELARILFAGSDVLCLDEPTNHLDVDAKLWLMGFLRQYRGALLVISHDLDLLDEAITRVLHLDRPTETAVGTIVEYKGTYSQYIAARAEDERRLAKLAAQQSKEIARLQRCVDRFGAKATKASMAHSIEKRIDRMEDDRVHAPKHTRAIAVRFPDPPSCGQTVLVAEHLCKGYGGPPVFEDVGFDLGRGERLLVLGLNGAGKTSLLRILAGESEADLGQFDYGHNVDARLLRPGARQPRPGRFGARQPPQPTCRRASCSPRPSCAACSGMMGLSGEKVFQDAGHPVGRREDQAGAGDADGRSQQPAVARRADQQPRSAVASGGGRRAHVVEGLDRVRQPRHRVRHPAGAHQGAADARRRRRLLQRRLAGTGEPCLIGADPAWRNRQV